MDNLLTVSNEFVMLFGLKSDLATIYLKRIAQGHEQAENNNLCLLNIWSYLTLLERFLEIHHQGKLTDRDSVDAANKHENLIKEYLFNHDTIQGIC